MNSCNRHSKHVGLPRGLYFPGLTRPGRHTLQKASPDSGPSWDWVCSYRPCNDIDELHLDRWSTMFSVIRIERKTDKDRQRQADKRGGGMIYPIISIRDYRLAAPSFFVFFCRLRSGARVSKPIV